MEYPSRLIENVVNELSSLPGIGKKTALRLALHMLKQGKEDNERLGTSIIDLGQNIKYCKSCHNISDDDLCNICTNPRRDKSVICVVEDTKDVMALEGTHQFQGIYHVLGGLINPLQGIGPSLLKIDPLVEKISQSEEIKEVIFAFSANIEGDTTAFYISKKLQPFDVKISSIARGIPVGCDLEFTDEVTLARSLVNRTLVATSSNGNGVL